MSEKKEKVQIEKPECFILMPISDQDGYKTGHFKRVYEQILQPACVKAGYTPIRADDVKQTNLIHLDILQRLLDAPMALCDLSTRNPNALFELGIRQAFDKPVVLVQEVGTKSIFDIAPIRYTEYRNDLYYEEVLQDQENIANAIKETEKEFKSGQGINSIVKLLSLTKSASLPESLEQNKDPLLQIIRAEIDELKKEIRGKILVKEQPSSLKVSESDDSDKDEQMRNFNLARVHVSRARRVIEQARQENNLEPKKQYLADAKSNLRKAQSYSVDLPSYQNRINEVFLEIERIEAQILDDEIPF